MPPPEATSPPPVPGCPVGIGGVPGPPEPVAVGGALVGVWVAVGGALLDGEGEGVAVAVVGGAELVAAQSARVIVLVSRDTCPFLARTRPVRLAPVCMEMSVSASTDPTKLVPVPRVAELPTSQNTLQACVPPTSATVLLLAVINVDPAWKTKTAFGSPWASSVTVPVRAMALAAL